MYFWVKNVLVESALRVEESLESALRKESVAGDVRPG